MNEPEVIRSMLGYPLITPRTIAVIGLSDRPDRPSHYVSAYMQQHGYKILPVNPSLDQVLGVPAYPSISALPFKPDFVNVFRSAGFLPTIVHEMLELGLTDLWVQQGIVNHEAARRAQAGSIRVVMDRCVMVEHRQATSR